MPPNVNCICRAIRVRGPYLYDKMRYTAVVPGTLLCDKTGLCHATKLDALMSDAKKNRPYLDQIEDFSTDLAID